MTLSELALEMLFPANEQTTAIVKSMADEAAAGLLGEPPDEEQLPLA